MQRSTRRLVIVKPIGDDLVPDFRILRLHAKSSLARNPVMQLLFEVSKEPPGKGNCLLTTIMARLGKRSFLQFFHIPVGGCQDPSICVTALGRFIVPGSRCDSPSHPNRLMVTEGTIHPQQKTRRMALATGPVRPTVLGLTGITRGPGVPFSSP